MPKGRMRASALHSLVTDLVVTYISYIVVYMALVVAAVRLSGYTEGFNIAYTIATAKVGLTFVPTILVCFYVAKKAMPPLSAITRRFGEQITLTVVAFLTLFVGISALYAIQYNFWIGPSNILGNGRDTLISLVILYISGVVQLAVARIISNHNKRNRNKTKLK